MGNVVIIKTAEHMDYGVCLPDIGKKLIAETLAFARAFDKPGNIYNLHCRGHYASRITDFYKPVQTLVRHRYHPDIRLYGTEWKVCRLGFGV